jgi:peptidoglycan/LPS O-acetylase OafA/YrhL
MKERGRSEDSTGSTREPRRFLSAIESARGVAALFVAISHTMGSFLLVAFNRPLLEQPSLRDSLLKLASLLLNGPAAVVVFFVISGLVIGRSLDRNPAQSPLAYLGFLARRALRIYPAHVAAILILIAAAPVVFAAEVDFSANPMLGDAWVAWDSGAIFKPMKWLSVAGNLMLATWSFNPVAWSLYVEVCAAPFLPFLHLAARRNNRAIDLVLLTLLVGLSAALWGRLAVCYLFAFYLGLIVDTAGQRWARFLIRTAGGPGWAALGCYVAIILPDAVAEESAPLEALEALAAFSLVSVIVAGQGTRSLRFLEHRSLRWAGRVSYSFYLWHLLILTVLMRSVHQWLPAEIIASQDLAIFIAMLIAGVGITGLVAQLSYACIEGPLVEFGRRFGGRTWWRHVAIPPAALLRNPTAELASPSTMGNPG